MSIAHCTIIQNPTKTILVEGNLKDGAISVNICKDYINVYTGTWNVAVKDLSFISIREAKHFFNITTNLVCGQFKNKDNRLEELEVPIQRFYLELQPNKQKFIKCDLIWFTVNRPSEQIFLNFKLWPTPEPATAISSIDVKVYLTLLFNRMQ
jgi:hypothetical protein